MLLCWPSLRSPSTSTGVTVPFMALVSRMRSAVASAVRRIVASAAPRAFACGLNVAGSALNHASSKTRSGSLDFRWATNTSVSGGCSRRASWKCSTGREKRGMVTVTSGVWASLPLDCSRSSAGNVSIHSGVPRSRPLRTSAPQTIREPVAGSASRSYSPSMAAASSTRRIASPLHSSWRPTMSASIACSCCAVHATLIANSPSVHGRCPGFIRAPGSCRL